MKKGSIIFLVLGVLLIMAVCRTGQSTIADNTHGIIDNRQLMLQSADSTDRNNITNNSTDITMNKQPTPQFVANTSKNANYEIIKQTYSEGKVKIHYPQVTKMGDSEKQEVINQIIKSDALRITGAWADLDKVRIVIDYEITWQSAELLSIKYSGLRDPLGAAHPTNEFYTTNINMHKGSRLRLKDFVKVDEYCVEKVKKGKLIVVAPEIKFEDFGYTNDKLIEGLNAADVVKDSTVNIYGAYSYFTNDSLGISVWVWHPIGDHAEFEVKYQDIADNIKAENEVWKSIYK